MPATIGGKPVSGIFDADFVAIRGELGDTESARPVFMCATEDVEHVEYGTTARINSTNYTVRGIQPDGTGITVLVLEI